METYEDKIKREGEHWRDMHTPEARSMDSGYFHNPRLREIADVEVRESMAEMFDVEHKMTVLDIGCGSGMIATHIAAYGHEVHAFDLSDEVFAEGKAEAAAKGYSVNYFVGDANKVELEPGKYDVIFAHDALHHLVEIHRLMDQINIGLKDDGRLFVIENDQDNKLNRGEADMLLSMQPKKYSESRENLKPKNLQKASPFEGACQNITPIVDEHFEIVSHKETHAIMPWFFRFQYNWTTEEDFEIAKKIQKFDQGQIAAGVMRGNKKIVVGKKRA